MNSLTQPTLDPTGGYPIDDHADPRLGRSVFGMGDLSELEDALDRLFAKRDAEKLAAALAERARVASMQEVA